MFSIVRIQNNMSGGCNKWVNCIFALNEVLNTSNVYLFEIRITWMTRLSFDLCTFPEILILYILYEISVELQYLEIYLEIKRICFEKYAIYRSSYLKSIRNLNYKSTTIV